MEESIHEGKSGLEPLMQEALALLRQIAANTAQETPVNFTFGSIPLWARPPPWPRRPTAA